MTIKAVLFDMFDTLMIIRKNPDFNSPSFMRMYRYLSENGVNVQIEKFQEAYNQARTELYAKADPNLEEPHFNVRIAFTLKILGYNYADSSPLVRSASAEFCREFMKYVYLDEDAVPLLRSLHGRYKLGVISNFAIPECVGELLETYGLNGLFDVVVVSGAINKRKPSPEIFNRTLSALEVSAAETVFVGDTMDADIEGAKAVGMKAVYIKRREERQIDPQPDVTIKSLTEITSLLPQL
ncbi:MAG TPA: HAD family hydrolase [Candidatus Limnocylindrales bacterium]|nr:HAD family hydrolase [Candidatus Limnocylindrales bacterium]